MEDGSFVFLFRDDTRQDIFLVYRSDWPIWSITGGGIENGETPEQAALRETYEETGFKVQVNQLIGKKTRYEKGVIPPKVRYVAYYFDGRVISGKFRPEFPGCRGSWFKVNHLPIDLLEANRKTIQLAVKGNSKIFEQNVTTRFFYRDFIILFRHPKAGIKFILKKK